MARRIGPNPRTDKPAWAKKSWNEQSARTQKRWGGKPYLWFYSTKEERAAKEGRGAASAPVQQESRYWRSRAANLIRKSDPRKEILTRDTDFNEEQAKNYYMAKTSKNVSNRQEYNSKWQQFRKQKFARMSAQQLDFQIGS